jgi:hypothetical protein
MHLQMGPTTTRGQQPLPCLQTSHETVKIVTLTVRRRNGLLS